MKKVKSKEKAETEKKPVEIKKTSVEIIRDNTFHRFVSDEMLYRIIGKTMDVSFIQYGHILEKQEIGNETTNTLSKNVLTEVARARISLSTLMNFYFNLLRKEIKNGNINKDIVLEKINSFEK